MADEWSMTDGPVPLVVGARLLGHLAWVEQRLHGVLGGWVGTTTEPDAAVLFDRHAQHHAWRSTVLVERLPQLRELPRADLVAAPGPGVLDLLAVLASLTTTEERLAGTYGVVVPDLLATYRGFVTRLTPVADAPLQRWLPLLERDLATDAGAAAALRPGTTDDTSGAVARVLDALAVSEGLTGRTGLVVG